MDEIEVPPFFLCPISLEIMKDPVAVSTGITYDRESIEKWLFSEKNTTCPVTKQILLDYSDLTPNITLRRLIQSWCTLNASNGIERFPTPKPPINKAQLVKLFNDAKSTSTTPQLQMKCLTKIRSLASESDTNKRCIEAAGAVDFLASIISINKFRATIVTSEDVLFEYTKATNEALNILCHLQLSETGLRSLCNKNGEFIESLTCIMERGNYESRTYAVLLLKSISEVADPIQLIRLSPKFFIELGKILSDQISQKASKATLQLLINVCPWGQNRIKGVEAGVVSVLIDLLLESSEKRECEMILMVLYQLCQCAEGRAEVLSHGAGLAIVSKKILRVSKVASDKAVRILHSISKFSATHSVVEEMLQLGVVAKLWLVLQVDCGTKTQERAREILKLHVKAWKNSSCLPLNFIASYPSCVQN